MNLKSLLLGSAAALAAVSGAHAADAIVAAEPEPMEYVRVCDAFGTGYFYIPGTETCLKIGGYVRFQVDFDDADDVGEDNNWNARTRALLNFETKSDTEYGALGSYIALRTWAEEDYNGGSVEIDEAYITLGGFKVGYMYNYWDSDLSGETDDIGSNRLNSVGYNYTGDSFSAGVFVDELSKRYSEGPVGASNAYGNDGVGVEAQISGAFGPVSASLLGGYDFHVNDGSIRAILSADVGPGTLSGAGVWSSGANAYYDLAEWTVAVQYAAKLGDKFTITPAFQYWSDARWDAEGDFGGGDVWRAGVTLDYKITEGLTSKVSLQYTDADDNVNSNFGDDETFSGFVRLQRSF
jgi:hypothetical protein